jgi:hypothetical protein
MSDLFQNLFKQMKSLGKLMVMENIDDFGDFGYTKEWQYGLMLWYASELLSLVNFFFPFSKQLEKAQLEQNIQKLEALKNAKSSISQSNQQDFLKRRRR